MPISRTFLDWTRPALPAVVDYVLGRFQRDNMLDLDAVVLVMPGGRAGRRLLELLVAEAEQRALVLMPPNLCTMGTLPELLYESKRPFASSLVQQLAWVRALKEMGAERCRKLVAQLPPDEDFAAWLDLGRLLAQQHRELAADVLDFADVARLGVGVPGFQELDRWQFLSEIQDRYLALLDSLELWDLQTARRVAIQRHECHTDRQILLVATTDMNQTMRQMLDQVADRVTALIHAPKSLSHGFDQHGCLVPDSWLDTQIPIRTDQVRIVDSPDDQAVAVVDAIRDLDGRYCADEIVVGILDEQIIPPIQQHLLQANLPNRWVVGKTVAETAPFRLLDILAQLADRARVRDFAALIRHPDVYSWIDTRIKNDHWLATIDRYYNDHLPATLDQWPADTADSTLVAAVRRLILDLLRPLRGQPASLDSWSVLITGTLSTFYGDTEFDPNVPDQYYTLKALEAIRSGLLEQTRVPRALMPELSVTEAITLLLAAVSRDAIPSPHGGDAIPLLGWLELPLDTAPVLIVTSLNEGCVPSAVNSDLFLPNTLRRHLGLVDNRRRYARDAYALQTIAASRMELTLIAGRRTSNDDPLAPSRLLFATDDETMAERARRFFQPPAAPTPQRSINGAHATADKSQLVVPKPRPMEQPLSVIPVTAFRVYLACPYRFYLRFVLRLRSVDDVAEELDGAAFGTMLHDILCQFGQETIRSSTDPTEIQSFLRTRLDTFVTEVYGQKHLPAIAVQIEQARARLDAFAQWQAERARQGWEIVCTETSGGEQPATLRIDTERSIALSGRIDRIDRREETWTVIDYKTSDKTQSPADTHLKGHDWVDLQLPLYRHIVKSLGFEGPVQLGYVILPRDVAKTGLLLADWEESELAAADRVAVDVARNVLEQRFWPPASPPPRTMPEFASICQDTAFQPNFESGGDDTREVTA